ncbi:ABC1 kinase family protein [Chitinivibrio alkaliphilus]|uniref:ABC1 family protein n=1 Tax=Chitinivibrio alkaliphilus ACht1 TaxID=1313304 RepID=U7D9T4_9BACT|nr:AarF/UbiB family protein [Chitinivibrio alkaliphilus]ERP31185.1 ABC1 family protein [Chitinivibrio alkaliphilus ACht1]
MIRVNKKQTIGKTYIHFRRYREIVAILFKFGFDNIIDQLNIGDVIPFLPKKKLANIHAYSNVERLRMAVEELGPTFIKLAQILSVRPDLVPYDIAREFSQLQDRVPPFSSDTACEIIEEQTGEKIPSLFLEFDKTPIAAGSVSQIHYALLHSGEEVAVKVQRPHITKKIEVDLEILYHVAGFIKNHHKKLTHHRLEHIVEEFAKTLSKELDFVNEAHNIMQFSSMFRSSDLLHVPRVYHEYSTEKLLVMEYIRGTKPACREELLEKTHLPPLEEIAKYGLSLIFEQIFIYGFFHADPHPGNVFILDSGKICYIDFGITGRVTREERETFMDLLLAISHRDEKKLVRHILKFTHESHLGETEKLERDFIELIDQYINAPLEEMRYSRIIHRLFAILNENRVSLKSHIYLMLKTLATTESLGRTLYPDLILLEEMRPFIRRIYRKRFSPRTLSEKGATLIGELLQLVRDFPEDIHTITQRILLGELSIELRHEGLREIADTLDRVSNRISFSIVLAALIVGSSLLIQAHTPPLWNDVSVIGLGGFLLAGLIAFILIFSMLRKRDF